MRGAVLLALGAGVAVLLAAPAVTIDLDAVLVPVSAQHPLGTDHLGRDLMARIAAGARPSVQAVGAALAGALGLGLTAGAAMSLGPAWLRAGIEALADLALALPTLIVALLMAAALGGGPLVIGAALALTAWAPYALTVARLSDQVRKETWWLAARALGVGGLAGFRRHILPAIAGRIGALAGADAGRAVILAASLGFLGLGMDTGRPCWGGLIHEYRMFLFTHPRLVLAPTLAIAVLSLGLHLLFDPVARKTPRRDGRRVV
jgi:ABC-type dipeptide/oligopeptide/nickel transport system permease subunit